MFKVMLFRMIACLLPLLLVAAAFAQELQVSSTMATEYQQGESASVTFTITLDDPDGVIDQGVLFLNVVENSPEKNYPQAAHLIFAAVAEEPPLFRRVLSGVELQAGQSTTLNFRLRDGARTGRYVAVVQLFRGPDTSPWRVRAENRVGLVGFSFTLLPRE